MLPLTIGGKLGRLFLVLMANGQLSPDGAGEDATKANRAIGWFEEKIIRRKNGLTLQPACVVIKGTGSYTSYIWSIWFKEKARISLSI